MPISEWSESITIAELSDEPLFSEDTDNLILSLTESSGSMPDVIVNLKDVTYMNSTNIAQLLKLRKKVLEEGARLRLCAVNDRVWTIMLATGLDKIFEFTQDISTSLASLQIQEP